MKKIFLMIAFISLVFLGVREETFAYAEYIMGYPARFVGQSLVCGTDMTKVCLKINRIGPEEGPLVIPNNSRVDFWTPNNGIIGDNGPGTGYKGAKLTQDYIPNQNSTINYEIDNLTTTFTNYQQWLNSLNQGGN